MKKIFLIIVLSTSINFAQGELPLLFGDDAITGVSYNANAQLYFDSLSTPLTDSVKVIFSTLYDDLDDSLNSGARNKTLVQLGWDRLWVFSNATSEAALRDIASRNNASVVSTPTFTVFQGYKSDADGKYINSNYNPSSNGTNYTQNNAGAFTVISDSAWTNVFKYAWGGINTNDAALGFTNTELYVYNLNQTLTASITPPIDKEERFLFNQRTASNAISFYAYDTTLTLQVTDTETDASTGVPDISFFILNKNVSNAPVAGGFLTQNLKVVGFGRSFDATERRKIMNCFLKFFRSINTTFTY